MTLIYNLQSQKNFRKKLRNDSTTSEKLLWYKIRNKQLGYKFRRQYGFGKYIADFYCRELRLVLEIDGACHETPEELKRDAEKEIFIKGLGVNVKRYLNIDIKNNINGVVENLLEYIKTLEANRPPLAPPCKGGEPETSK